MIRLAVQQTYRYQAIAYFSPNFSVDTSLRPPIRYSSQSRCTGNTSKGFVDHYHVLGLNRTASKRDIKAAFLTLSKQHHPDTKLSKDKNHEMFVRIAEAYKVLSNRDSRTEYDYLLLRQQNPNLPHSGDEMSKYYKDGTIYTGPRERDPNKRSFTNSQIVMGAIIFAIIGGVVQLSLVTYFSRKREENAQKIHQDALAHIEKLRSLSSIGQTSLQLGGSSHQQVD